MTKHQLRIGNKVKVFGKIYTIKELGEYEAAMEETEGVFSYEDVQGVGLTPSILQACGFVEDRDRYDGETIIFRLGCTELHHDEDQPLTGYSIAVYDDGNICFAGHDIRYLHQLMNLHHALTGTELTVNIEQVKV